jgi:hypothetical protein
MCRHRNGHCARFAASFLALTAFVGSPVRSSDLLPSALSRATQNPETRPEGVPSDVDLQRSGATIGDVLIEPMDIFEAGEAGEARAFRAANRLHPRTRPETIAAQLLFHSGEPYSADRLAESERILRSARYLSAASVVPVAYHDGQVDVRVRTRDVWTLNPGLSFGRSGGANAASLELEEMNLLGTGTQVGISYGADVDRSSATLSYRDEHLGDSWWRIAAGLANNSDGGGWHLDLEQPFYALGTPRAGGVSLLDSERVDSRYDLGEVVDEYHSRNRTATAYTGWSNGLVDGWTRRWTAGFTVDDARFEAAADTVDPAGVPADRRLSYPWLGYELLENRYQKRQNRDQIGRVEDLSLGWKANARLGWAAPAFGADRSALVFNGAASKGVDVGEDSTLLLGASLNGRLEDGGFASTILGGSARFHHHQSPKRVLYASLQADAGYALDADVPLELGGDNGLRGYPLRYQGGEGRWLVTLEQRWFTDWYPLRLFQVGGAAFFDAGSTWGDNPYGSASRGLLKDVGIGLRLGNNRSALGNVLHVDLAMPLDGDQDISRLQLLIGTKASF